MSTEIPEIVSYSPEPEFARDYGALEEAAPRGVARPQSAEEVARVIRYARRQGLQIAARGRAHSAGGQALTAGGIVIDMRALACVHYSSPSTIEIDAGADWQGVVDRCAPFGTVPPVLPNHLPLSIGGTLSMGGLGETSFRLGQVGSAVEELEVVTGLGDILRCSPQRNAELFEAALGGLGQFAILTRARIALTPRPAAPAVCRALYFTLDRLIDDLTRLAFCGPPVIGLAAMAFSNTDQAALDAGLTPPLLISRRRFPWLFLLLVTCDGGPATAREILSGLQSIPISGNIETRPAFPVSEPLCVDPPMIHPWVGMIVPAEELAAVLSRTLETRDPEAKDHALFTMYPIVPARLRSSFLRHPQTRLAVFLDYLRSVHPQDCKLPAVRQSMREFYDLGVRHGGFYYPSGALRLSPSDWRAHFGPRWEEWMRLKQNYDPYRILNPGPSIDS